MQNNKLNTILLTIIVLLLGLGVVFFVINKNTEAPVQENSDYVNNQNLPAVHQSSANNTKNTPPPAVQHSLSTTLPAPYIGGQEGWPPAIQTSSAAYSCIPSHSEMSDTVQRTINNKPYCISIFSEGAAGHIYKTYTYKTATNPGTKTTTFTLGYQSCGVYDDTQRTQCQAAQANFDSSLDAIVDSLMF